MTFTPGDAPSMTPTGELSVVARRQHGAFSHEQARAAGFSRRQIVSRLAGRLWVPVHPRIMRFDATPMTRALSASAARLYAGERAWFSHASAARLQGIDPRLPLDRVWLTVPIDVQRRPRPGVRITRSRRIEGFTSTAHGEPVLDRERTIVDLAAVLDLPDYRRVLYDAISRELVTIEGVLAAAADFGGKPGIALVHEAADEFDAAFESGLEHEADDLLRAADLVLERQMEIWEEGILIARLDFADEELQFGVEVDGARFHSSATSRRYDRERDRMLRLRGWHIERFSTDDVRRRPASMQRSVVALYRARCAERRRAA